MVTSLTEELSFFFFCCSHEQRFVFEDGLKQMQLNEPGGKKLERQNFWQKVKHTNWYPDRLQALIRVFIA